MIWAEAFPLIEAWQQKLQEYPQLLARLPRPSGPQTNRRSASASSVKKIVPRALFRRLVRYEIEPGVTTEAYLLIAAEISPEKRRGWSHSIQPYSHSILQPAGREGRC